MILIFLSSALLLHTFEGFEYYKSSHTMTYSEAEEFCAELDGNVVSLKSDVQNDMLGDLVLAERHSWSVHRSLFCNSVRTMHKIFMLDRCRTQKYFKF